MLIFATLVREETLTIKFIQACNRPLVRKNSSYIPVLEFSIFNFLIINHGKRIRTEIRLQS